MYDFTYYTPTRVILRRGAAADAGAQAAGFGAKKVLLHYGGSSAEKSGLLDVVRASLREAAVDFVELGGVVPNPELGLVREGIALCKKEGVDFLLAVGGGSVIDSAKAIGYGLGEPDKDVWELFLRTRAPKACYPVGVVLTIAAAGSEMSNSCVITDETTKSKRSCGSDYCRPKFALMDPEITMTLPKYQTMSGCADIIMHTLERYFTQGGNMDITDELAGGLIRSVMRSAAVLDTDPNNYEARANVMWASSLSHNGLTGCGIAPGGDFATHRLEHELSGKYGVTHGAGLTAIWGTWARYVYKECLPRFVKFAVDVMEVEPASTDEETALAGIRAMEDFFRSIGMPTDIKGLGVEPTEEDLLDMARRCSLATKDALGSAKVLREADMLAIYRAAR